jgi:hypothetical protein
MNFLWGRNELCFQRIQLFWEWPDPVCNTKSGPAEAPRECLLAVIKRWSFLLNLGSDKNRTRIMRPANLYRQNFSEIEPLACRWFAWRTVAFRLFVVHPTYSLFTKGGPGLRNAKCERHNRQLFVDVTTGPAYSADPMR